MIPRRNAVVRGLVEWVKFVGLALLCIAVIGGLWFCDHVRFVVNP
jgi:hypothetical protein